MHADRRVIDMKHIKQGFSLKAGVQSPGVDLGGRAKAKIKLFGIWSCCIISNLGLPRMQQHGSKYFAQSRILDPGMGSKGQTIFF